MTAYQNYWNAIIEDLLNQLEATDALHLNIADTLANSQRTQIFPNHIINALKIGVALKEGNINTAFVAPMQSGKSGTAYVLCNYVLPEIGFLTERESVLFVTSMRDTDLYEQNKTNMERDFYDCSAGQHKQSFVQVMKMNEFFNSPNPQKVVKDFRVKLIIRDEDQYGCGEDSSFDVAFFSALRERMPEINLLAISATPYDILDAKQSGYPVEVIEGERPEQYFGITEMLQRNLIEDYPRGFNPLQEQTVDGDTLYSLHPIMDDYVQHLLGFEDGLGIVRVSKTSKALNLRTVIRNRYKKDLEVVCIGSDSECDYCIKEGLDEVSKRVMRQQKRIVLIVVQALSAGKDMRTLKGKVRFGIESRGGQLANGAQGIAGRLCGYHENRDFRLMANRDLLEHYAQFEQDWEIYADEDWKNRLYDLGVRNFSTQTSQRLTQRAGVVRPIVEIKELGLGELMLDSGRDQLHFIDDEGYDLLLSFFEQDFYDRDTKGTRFRQQNVTVRIASSYNQEDNRTYKLWRNVEEGDDFGSVMFKKQEYKYGILIVNYPEDDPRNEIGFRGIKVIEAGKAVEQEQITSTENSSMYARSEDEEGMEENLFSA